MPIGTFGAVTFEASREFVRTFDDLQRSGQTQYAEHARIGLKPLLQYVSPGLETISFKMSFSVELHVDPRGEIDLLRVMRDQGHAALLVLDGRPLGRFVVQSLSETWRRVDNTGYLCAAEVQVSLKEYVEAKA
ncbi:phage tail protein [Pyramidobacter piscolens]|uniref:phage tail protein n=1 Tax=Pyramidobacter piscolens TaxID=638849 RepID=UPI00249107A3|nr:phage tail protein [Pyramidobacter piscolens]